MNHPPFSVVVPVFNEEETAPLLAREIAAALAWARDWELIFVDDGSRDATIPRLRALKEEIPGLRVVAHLNNAGQSAAIRTGVKAARCAVVITLDGDGQNDPADVRALLDRYHAPDRPARLVMVGGHRVNRRDTWLRRFSSRTANAIRGGLLQDRTPDSGCGLKVFSREAFLDLPWFDHMHRFLAALFLRGGGEVASVAVNHRPRERGVSKYGVWNRLWVGMADLLGVMWLLRRARRSDVREESWNG